MKIHIEQKMYEQMNDNDKIRFFIINTDPHFEETIIKAREEIKAKHDNWWEFLIDKYDEYTLFIPSDQDEYKKWLIKRKEFKATRKTLNRETQKIIKKFYYLDDGWRSFVEGLICENDIQFFPSNYGVGEINGHVCIYISSVTTKNDFIDWVNSNWRMIIATYRTPIDFTPHRKKKKNLPDYDNLSRAIEIINLKDKNNLTFSDILKRMFSKEYMVDERKVENIYYRVKKEIAEFQKEQENFKNLLAKLNTEG